MAKDAIGNELHEGDLVMCQLPPGTTSIRCRVAKIKGGGIALVAGQEGQADVTPGNVELQTRLDSQFDPATGIVPNLHKLQDPNKQKTGLLAN